MVTGESLPVEKSAGHPMTGGTLNGNGSVVMRAERVGEATLLAQIVRMVAEAQRTRAPIQRLADRIAEYFVPAVVLVSIISFIGWTLWGPSPRLAFGLVNAIAVLIIACPCALGLATPMAIMVGTGRGAAAGVLIRNADALERLERVDTLVVDKTGTLTEGAPAVTAVRVSPGSDEPTLVRLVAALEQASEHPLGAAIVRSAKDRGIALPAVAHFESVTGQGVVGEVEGHRVLAGTRAFLTSRGVDVSRFESEAAALGGEGQTVVFAAIDERAAGIFGIADRIKPSTPEALELLKREGILVFMLTGDNKATASAVAQKLGIPESQVHAEVLPGDKRDVVKRLESEGRVVAMAGDGINDAPALAAAAVGIAMGTGTDVAMQSAGITLVKGDLRAIARARRLSRATMRNIRQNLFLAFAYNMLGVPVAAGALYPFFGILIAPIWAGAAMTFSSVSVILNALRLRRVDL